MENAKFDAKNCLNLKNVSLKKSVPHMKKIHENLNWLDSVVDKKIFYIK